MKFCRPSAESGASAESRKCIWRVCAVVVVVGLVWCACRVGPDSVCELPEGLDLMC